MNEYEYEPTPGLPEALPEGEHIVWQGAPEWRAMARRVFRVRGVTAYFCLLMAWYLGDRLASGATAAELVSAATLPLLLGASALAILYLLAWLFARSTLYTLTNRRLVMRFGVAIPMMINLPLEKLVSADLAEYGDGLGDISLTLAAGEKISYIALWPHARPWHYSPVKPMLRGLHNASIAAALLANEVRGATANPETVVRPEAAQSPRKRPDQAPAQPAFAASRVVSTRHMAT